MHIMLITILFVFVLLLLAFAGIAIKIIVRKNGQFKRHCSSMDPYTGERAGCICGGAHAGSQDETHPAGKKCHRRDYQPLEVNEELRKEL